MSFAFFDDTYSYVAHAIVDRIGVVAEWNEIKNLEVLKKLFNITEPGDRIFIEYERHRLDDLDDVMHKFDRIQKENNKLDLVPENFWHSPTNMKASKKIMTAFLMGFIHEGPKIREDQNHKDLCTSIDFFNQMKEAQQTIFFESGRYMREYVMRCYEHDIKVSFEDLPKIITTSCLMITEQKKCES